jgi:RND family efflux transporter MFP subunit
VASLLFVGCSEKKHEEIEVIRPVKTMQIKSQKVSGRQIYPGKVIANKVVDLAFEVDGPIIEMKVKQGDRVKQGDIIARLDPRDYRSALKVNEAKLKEAESDYKRYSTLVKKGVVSVADYEIKNRNYEVAKNKYELSKKALADTNLIAPFNGIIAAKFVENFQNIRAKQKIFTLQDEKKINITINVPEQDVAKARRTGTLKERRKLLDAKAIFPVDKKRTFPVSVKEFQAKADSVTQTFEVVFEMPAPKDILIRSGMTAEISVNKAFFNSGSTKGFEVPLSAIFIDEKGNKVVWKISNGVAKSISVKTSDLSSDNVLIDSENLKTDDIVAIAGVSALRDGMKVRTVNSSK